MMVINDMEAKDVETKYLKTLPVNFKKCIMYEEKNIDGIFMISHHFFHFAIILLLLFKFHQMFITKTIDN